jgi:hypothetical protein
LNEAAVMVERKWQFKTKFRAKAFGWRGSRLAISRLKEAVSEINATAKSDPVAAGDGAVSLMERIWPAFQDIDTSSVSETCCKAGISSARDRQSARRV